GSTTPGSTSAVRRTSPRRGRQRSRCRSPVRGGHLRCAPHSSLSNRNLPRLEVGRPGSTARAEKELQMAGAPGGRASGSPSTCPRTAANHRPESRREGKNRTAGGRCSVYLLHPRLFVLVNVDGKRFTSGELSSPLRGIGSAPGSLPGLAAHHEQGGEGSVDDGAIRVQHEPLRVLPVGQVGGVGPRVLDQVADQGTLQ